jgi:hypothetical protein
MSQLYQTLPTLYQTVNPNPNRMSDPEDTGRCAMCDRQREVFVFATPKTFTDHDLFSPTGYICPACKFLWDSRQKLRYANWVLTEETWQKLSRWEVLPTFLKLDPEPFCCYTTNSYKRYGFFQTLKIVNQSPTFFLFAHDHHLISFEKAKVIEYGKFIRKAQAKGIYRSQLKQGRIHSNKNLSPDELYAFNTQLLKYHHHPLWMWTLDFCPPQKEHITVPYIDGDA